MQPFSAPEKWPARGSARLHRVSALAAAGRGRGGRHRLPRAVHRVRNDDEAVAEGAQGVVALLAPGLIAAREVLDVVAHEHQLLERTEARHGGALLDGPPAGGLVVRAAVGARDEHVVRHALATEVRLGRGALVLLAICDADDLAAELA